MHFIPRAAEWVTGESVCLCAERACVVVSAAEMCGWVLVCVFPEAEGGWGEEGDDRQIRGVPQGLGGWQRLAEGGVCVWQCGLGGEGELLKVMGEAGGEGGGGGSATTCITRGGGRGRGPGRAAVPNMSRSCSRWRQRLDVQAGAGCRALCPRVPAACLPAACRLQARLRPWSQRTTTTSLTRGGTTHSSFSNQGSAPLGCACEGVGGMRVRACRHRLTRCCAR